jgi:hypothetical protein
MVDSPDPAVVDVLLGGASAVLTPAEGAAATMLAVIMVVAALVGFCAWSVARRSRRPDATLEFLEDLDRARRRRPPPTRKRTNASEPGMPPWEKPADWWKK